MFVAFGNASVNLVETLVSGSTSADSKSPITPATESATPFTFIIDFAFANSSCNLDALSVI